MNNPARPTSVFPSPRWSAILWILIPWVLVAVIGSAAIVSSGLPLWWGGGLLISALVATSVWMWAGGATPGRDRRAQVAWFWTVALWLLAAGVGLSSLVIWTDVSAWAWGSTLAVCSVVSMVTLARVRWTWSTPN